MRCWHDTQGRQTAIHGLAPPEFLTMGPLLLAIRLSRATYVPVG